MKVALILTLFKREELLKKCLDSLDLLTKKPNEIIYVDDGSNEFFIDGFLAMQAHYAHIIKKKNAGIKDSLRRGFDKAFEIGCDIAINLDPDSIVKPDFISRLINLKTRFPDRIISGFNCNHPKNPVLFDGPDYVERKHANGINMCMNKHDYENIVRPALLKEGNWDFNSTNNKNFIITKGSVVQHLGADCSTLGHVGGDVACDF